MRAGAAEARGREPDTLFSSAKTLQPALYSATWPTQVDWDKKEHHLLGYFPDVEWQRSELSPAMTTLQAEVAKVRHTQRSARLACRRSPLFSFRLFFFFFSFFVIQVKDSRENRNQQMVSYLNELLASPTGRCGILLPMTPKAGEGV